MGPSIAFEDGCFCVQNRAKYHDVFENKLLEVQTDRYNHARSPRPAAVSLP